MRSIGLPPNMPPSGMPPANMPPTVMPPTGMPPTGPNPMMMQPFPMRPNLPGYQNEQEEKKNEFKRGIFVSGF